MSKMLFRYALDNTKDSVHMVVFLRENGVENVLSLLARLHQIYSSRGCFLSENSVEKFASLRAR